MDHLKTSFTQNYHTQAQHQRILNTLENQDHMLIQSLFRTDQEIVLDAKNSVMMKRVGNSYDKAGSKRRAEYELMKKLAQK